MSRPAGFPFEALNANLALQARLLQLVQENGQRWVALGRELATDATFAKSKSVADALRSGNWQQLAAMPMEAFWAPLQGQFSTSRKLSDEAAAAQSAFIEGLQDALRTWQKDVSTALAGDASARPFGGPAWIDLVGPWQQWLSEAGKDPKSTRTRKS